ncbi:MAG: universal stress protein [Actinomycetota bacterium]|nr:universal stress protein [Actinomycetota bacterium]
MVDAAARGARARDRELLVTAHLINGDPSPSLVAFADGAALLVVGRRGLGWIGRLLPGSVSSYCAAHAPCALAVVPQPMENDLAAEQIGS